jgi:hypothetical protein
MLGAAVTEIDYSNADADGKICVSYIQAGIPQKTECDAVVVSVPLGVLKSSISGDSGKRDTAAGSGGGGAEEVRWGGGMRFTPALPCSKSRVIENMGFGLLNKVVPLA